MALKRKLRVFKKANQETPSQPPFSSPLPFYLLQRKRNCFTCIGFSHHVNEFADWATSSPFTSHPSYFATSPPFTSHPFSSWDRRRLGAPYSQSILGEVPAKLRQLAIRKKHQDIFKEDKSKNNHHSGKAQFLQAATANARHHAPAIVSRPVKGGIQRLKLIFPSHLSNIDVKVGSHSNINENVYSQTTPAEKRFVYNSQELLACRFHYPRSQEILLVCVRLHLFLGGAGQKKQAGPPPSLDWIPYINRRTHQVRLFRREVSIAVKIKDELSANTLGVPVFVGLSPCASRHPLVPLPQLGHKKRYHSKDQGAHSGNSKRFRLAPKKIEGHLSTFSAHSLQVSLKINQGKRKFTFEEKGQLLKRRKSARLGAEILSSGFALVLLIIFGLWRLLLYNSRISQEGSLALSRHAPSLIGYSEVVPQQPSSQP